MLCLGHNKIIQATLQELIIDGKTMRTESMADTYKQYFLTARSYRNSQAHTHRAVNQALPAPPDVEGTTFTKCLWKFTKYFPAIETATSHENVPSPSMVCTGPIARQSPCKVRDRNHQHIIPDTLSQDPPHGHAREQALVSKLSGGTLEIVIIQIICKLQLIKQRELCKVETKPPEGRHQASENLGHSHYQ